MSSITIRDLSRAQSLDQRSMAAVRGGYVLGTPMIPAGVGSPTVNVAVNQNINQFQYTNVSALNNNGYVGSGIGPLHFDVSPTLWAANTAVV